MFQFSKMPKYWKQGSMNSVIPSEIFGCRSETTNNSRFILEDAACG